MRHLTLSTLCAMVALTFANPTEAAAYRIGLNFAGSKFGTEVQASPADGNGAIGPNHFVEFINGRFAVYAKTTGTRVKNSDDVTFWARAGVTLTTGYAVSDPRVIYDPVSSRWFASMVDFKTSAPGSANHFLIAVSATSDPTGTWRGISFAPDITTSYFGDFPTLGIDASGVYISAFMFDNAGNSKGSVIDAIPKSSLLTIPPTTTGIKRSGVQSFATRGQVVQPAVTTGSPTTPEVMLAIGDLGLDFKGHDTVVLSETSALTLGAATTITVPTYFVPINPPQPNGWDGLDDGDGRISGMVRRVGDIVYGVHGTQIDPNPSSTNNGIAALQWFKIDAVSKTLLDTGIIQDPVMDLFYGSIAANEAGDVVITCNGCSTNTFISSFAYIAHVKDGKLAFSGPKLLKAGTASYETDTDITDRWGDYSATSVDPNDPNRFWAIHMIPIATTIWTTQITQIILGVPALSAVFDGANLTLSWTDTQEVHLETSPDLSAGSWQSVAAVPAVSGGVASVTVGAASGNAFFRLAED